MRRKLVLVRCRRGGWHDACESLSSILDPLSSVLSSSLPLWHQAQPTRVIGKSDNCSQRQIVWTFENIPILVVDFGPARGPSQVALGDAGEGVVRTDAVHGLARFVVKIPGSRFVFRFSIGNIVK